MTADVKTAPRLPSQWIVPVLCIAGTVVSLQQTLVVPLIPEWPKLLGTSEDNASWLVTATLLSGAVATPILARLADMVGKRRIMIVALAAIIVGSLLGVFFSSFAVVCLARALQGMGASLIPIGISILRDELPREKVGAAVAMMSATMGIGSAVGLPLAGVLVEHFSWHALFIVSAVMGVLMLSGVLLAVPESQVKAAGRFDLLGALGLSAALLLLLIPISKGGHWGWTSESVIVMLVGSAIMLAIWTPWELRHPSPMVDLRTSARRPVLLTNVASLLIGFAMYANMMTTTQQLQMPEFTGYGFGLSLIAAGLCMLPGGLAMVFLSPVSAALTKRFGARTTLLIGALALGCAYIARAYLTDAIWQIVLGATLCSAATAIAYAAMPSLIMRSVPITETASANGLNALLRSVGTSTSSAAVAAVLTNIAISVHGHVLPQLQGFRVVFFMAALAALASACVTAFIPRAAGVPAAVAHPATVAAESAVPDVQDVVVTGSLLTPTGLPVRRAVVTALAESGAHIDWGRVEGGTYKLALPGEGRYVLVASGDGWATKAEFVELSGDTLPTLHFSQRLQLTGVATLDGTPMADASITLITHSGEYHASTATDADGKFALPLPPTGRYVVAGIDTAGGRTCARSVMVVGQPVSITLEF